MQKMKFGLNVPAKKKTQAVLNRHSTFAQQDPDDEEEQAQTSHRANVNQQLSQQSVTNKKIAEQHAKALEEDANIFDYDAVYDDLKEAERKKKEALKGPDSKKVTCFGKDTMHHQICDINCWYKWWYSRQNISTDC